MYNIKYGLWVLRGSVKKCLTRNPGVFVSSRTGSPWSFMGMSSGKTLQSPQPIVLTKPMKDTNNVSCHRDMSAILLKVT